VASHIFRNICKALRESMLEISSVGLMISFSGEAFLQTFRFQGVSSTCLLHAFLPPVEVSLANPSRWTYYSLHARQRAHSCVSYLSCLSS